ncbi:MAG: dihydrolipoyllysine-residue acetyltransferase [Gammaproteobacteria bacterium]|nr:dihydrolipoyllysine-residue acetyltransferase [Gammaproteobacteria bacterium]
MANLIEVKVPDLGDVSDAEIIEISISVDDAIDVEDTLIVLETEKATMDVPSSTSGIVKEIVCKPGDKVTEGSVILKLAASSVEEKQSEDQDEPQKPEPEVSKNMVDSEVNTKQKVFSRDEQKPAIAEDQALHEPMQTGVVYASPAIRRFARELGVDLTAMHGSGIKGRILKEDIRQHVKKMLSKQSTASTGTLNIAALPNIDFSKFGDTETIALTKIQKFSSANLHRNWLTIPHVTQNDDADITEMDAFRKSVKDEALSEGIRLTPLTFMLKAVVASLKAFPRFNSSLSTDDQSLILKKYFHIGVAVDTPEGLVVPVIRDVDKKSIYQLATELAEVSASARDKKLGIDAMKGSCFTISSLGGIGGTSFTPIVNWPDVAILGVSKSTLKPVWNGQEFEPRLMLPLSLSYDHRVIDGADGARFITHLSRTMGDIRRLLL